ncbi:MAG: hypothetical protein JOZ80_16610 [Acidobacteriaceae bacterium]|nr:hypothetical protein [Acidobacteriaceae bacterium]
MASINHNSVYNPRNHVMRVSVGVTWAICLGCVLLQTAGAFAADWQVPVGQLAQRIAGMTGPGAVAVTVLNRSSLTTPEVEDIRRKLVTELAAYGVQASTAEQAASTVQVSLSENLKDYLWVAEIHQGTSEPVVIMLSVPGGGEGTSRSPSAPLSIRTSLIWSGEQRILDVAVINGNPPHMVVLEPEQIALYRMQNGNWQLEQSLALIHVRPWPRDLRGRLILRKDHLFDAYLPGVYCRSSTAAPLTVTCDDSDDPWPLTGNPGDPRAFFSSTRNFFTGALSPGIQKQASAPAFYSAAPLPRDQYTLWIFTGVDGRVHLLDGITDQVLPQLAWGSDIASVRSGCGTGWQILATSRDDAVSDQVKAFEILDREPAAIGLSAEFQGHITALWSEDETRVMAVAKNSDTGKYEAFTLSIDCHQ